MGQQDQKNPSREPNTVKKITRVAKDSAQPVDEFLLAPARELDMEEEARYQRRYGCQ